VKNNSPVWLKWLPASLRARLEHRTNLHKALHNTGWLFADRILRMGVGLLVGVWVARYLGPEQFGLLSYALAFVALFGSVANLGLGGIVVRDIVNDPETASSTLGTAVLLQIAGGLSAFFLVVVAIDYARPEDSMVKLMVTVLSFGMIFKATEVVKYWFESQVQSRYSVWVENGVVLLLAGVKIGLIMTNAPLMAFVWAILAEGVLVALGLLVVYARYGGSLFSWIPSMLRAKAMLKDSWPLILSGLAVMIYMRIDQIMIGQMLDDHAVGIYTAAVRISEVWYFIPVAIVASVYPALMDARKNNEDIYYKRLQKLYDWMVLLAIAVALPMTFMSDWLVVKLFTERYVDAGTVLAIHIWTGLFVVLGVASGRWYLIENLQMHAFFRAAFGAVVNVVANAFLIPKYGVAGAAFATLLSQAIASYLSDYFNVKTRRMFFIKTKSLLIIHN
jgi:PST family polysaccharide transporter